MIAGTTILFSTQAEVVRYRKCLAAQTTDSALGVNVTTPNALVEELWEVWGSGEALVSAHQRSLIIKSLLAHQDEWVDSAGTVELLARFVGDWGGYIDADLCALHKADLTASDEEIIAFVKRYTEALAQAGLIEPACALDQIRSSVRLGTVMNRQRISEIFWGKPRVWSARKMPRSLFSRLMKMTKKEISCCSSLLVRAQAHSLSIKRSVQRLPAIRPSSLLLIRACPSGL